MNLIFSQTNLSVPLSPSDLTIIWNDFYNVKSDYDLSRINGNLCDCNGNGQFILLPSTHEAVLEGGKLYMVCRRCGDSSHL